MNVDWKLVCQSSGYKSLKAAYVADAADARRRIKASGRSMRAPAELYAAFQRALVCVYRIAQRKEISFVDALNMAEKKRDYWWLNFYNTYEIERVLDSPYPSLRQPWSKETKLKFKRNNIRKLVTRKRKRSS